MALKNLSWPMLVSAVLIGLLAAFLSVVYLKYRERQIMAELRGPETQTVAVVVASADLPVGAVLGAGNLAVRQVPAEYVHPNTVSPAEFDAIDGRTLIQPLAKGRALLKNFIVDLSAQDFSDTIAEGHRAVTIQVDELNAIGGHARPGNHIDIFALVPEALKPLEVSVEKAAAEVEQALAANESTNKVVLPVLQDVLVLATGERAHGDFAEKYSVQAIQRGFQQTTFTTITVDVTPKQAALLAQAEEYGDLMTLLRNRVDSTRAGFAEVPPVDLFDNAKRMVSEGGGRIITSDGRVIDTAGLKKTDNGFYVTPDGTVISADGKVMTDMIVTADGRAVDVSGMRKTKDGFYVTDDGRVLTKDGKVLAGVTVNAAGEVVTATGEVLKADDVVVNADGSVTRKDGQVIAGVSAADAVISENGEVIEDYIVASDGTVIDASGMTKTKDGFYVTADGKVLTKDGKVLDGVTVNAAGEVVTASGEVLKADDVVVNADGSVTRKDGQAIAGVSGQAIVVNKDGTVATADGKLIRGLAAVDGGAGAAGYLIEFLAGGNSKDGVAIPGLLPVLGKTPALGNIPTPGGKIPEPGK